MKRTRVFLPDPPSSADQDMRLRLCQLSLMSTILVVVIIIIILIIQ